MAIVKGVRVHFHEHHHGVQQQEDLGRPRPLEDKRHGDPKGEPQQLVDALDGHASLGPCESTPRRCLSKYLVQGQADQGGGHHEEVGNGQMPQLDGEEGPYLDAEGISRVLHVPQYGGHAHDGQANPEQVEEAMKIAVVAFRIKV